MTLRERLFALPDQYINLDRRDERRELIGRDVLEARL
jgi:hypothetical protein